MRVEYMQIGKAGIFGRLHPVPFLFAFSSGFCLAGGVGVLADSLLDRVPDNVAGIIVLPHAEATAGRVNDWCKQLGAGDHVADVDRWLTRIGIPLDVWDGSAPVALIIVKPGPSNRNWAVCFKPKSLEDFENVEAPGKVHRVDRLPRAKYVFCRDGYVFAAPQKATARLLAQSDSGKSLWSVLDERQRDLFDHADLFLHLDMGQWREHVVPVVKILTGLVKLGATPQSGDALQAETAQAMVDWFADGFEHAVEQMQGLTLALSLDQKGLSFSHYHRFKPDGPVAGYLSQVKATGLDLWAGLPNRPFILFCGADWSCPSEASVGAKLTRHLFGIDAVAAQLPEDQRDAIIRETASCYGQMQGMNLIATTPAKSLRPIEIYGSYTFDDAEKGLEQMRLLERHAARLASCFKPVAGCFGPVEQCRRDGVEFDEMRFDVGALDERSRKSMTLVYGENCRYQQALVSKNRVVYAITEVPDAICRVVKACKAGIDGISDNHPVRRVVKALPKRANAVAIVDLARFYAVGRNFVHAESPERYIVVSSDEQKSAPAPGPLIGWAGVVQDGNFLGQFYLGVEDAVAITKLAGELGMERHGRGPASRPSGK